MKPTNEKVGIELRHMVTDTMNTWYFNEHSVPAQSYIDDRIDSIFDKKEQIVKKHDLPTKDNGTVDYQAVPDEKEDVIITLSELNKKILKLRMDGLACILKLKGELPEDYDNEREYLEEHIGSYDVIPVIKNFFSQHFGSSTVSHADGSKPLILFRKPNGETIDPMKELEEARQKADEKRQTGSESKSSSTD